MSKLFKLKKWLTLPDAAKHLTSVFEEEVTEADILRLALDGKIKLAIQLINGAYANLLNPIDISNLKYKEVPALHDGTVMLPIGGSVYRFGDGVFQVIENITELYDGIWDLPLFNDLHYNAARHDLENRYQMLTGGAAVTTVNIDGSIIVADTNGGLYMIQALYDDGDRKHYYPAGRLPEDGILVIRTDALREFEQSINDIPAITEKPITTTERNTLLTIIAALCDYSAITHQERGTAAQLVKMTQEIGAAVSDDTIRKILKQIPDALESRTK
jgi:hypothetical protein